ncbi:MAG: vWA domain-containing protein [Bacteroidota bacterium]
MFLDFFLLLRKQGLPVSLKEYLTLLEALDQDVGTYSVEDFYTISQAALVKHEKHLDAFDQCFAHYFRGMELIADTDLVHSIPEDWLRKNLELYLTKEEMNALEKLGGPDALRERYEELLKEQRERHEGGNKWIGTGGRSPFGAYGFNPEGYRIGQAGNRNRRAIKVWDKRQYRNLRDDVELDTRGLKMALRKLRAFSREGLPEELDLKKTIDSTSREGGMLSLEFVPPRKNNVKVLMLMDIGGSMDDFVRQSERLFSAARHTFKNLAFFYFHNCPYEFLWRDNRRRHTDRLPTYELLHTYNSDWKLIFVGDAAMSPYEIVSRGGSVEHWNQEAGSVWLRRLLDHFPNAAWLNPTPEQYWGWHHSTDLLRELMNNRMYALTPKGIEAAVKEL